MANYNYTLARQTYRTLLEAVEVNKWKCGQDDGKMEIDYGVHGDFLHMKFIVSVDAERQLVSLKCVLPDKFPKEKTSVGAMVTCAANYALSDGHFEFNIDDGSVCFKMTENFRGSILSREALKYLLNYSVWAI
ncbi:MAG: YbjN domain-containing protein, partial [Clostridia bacterium]|nr:YbjN domain-containing protein [Clostridia bacterium]